MKISILMFALALSVLFNVFFGMGYVRSQVQAREMMEVAQAERDRTQQAVAQQLSLSEAQQAVFARLRNELGDEHDVIHEQMGLARQQLHEELAQPEPDIEQVRSLVASLHEFHEQKRQGAMRRFNEFVGVLSPEQCRRLSQSAHRERHGDRWRRRVLEKFDTNGDGELNDDERAAAQEHYEQRRAEMEGRRARVLEMFDADGDGKLDEDERAALERYREENPEFLPKRRRHRGDGRDGRSRQDGPPPGPPSGL